MSFTDLDFTAHTPAGKIEVRSSLVGRINVYNILAAIGAALALNVPVEKNRTRHHRIWNKSRDVSNGSMKANRSWLSWTTRMQTTLCAI